MKKKKFESEKKKIELKKIPERKFRRIQKTLEPYGEALSIEQKQWKPERIFRQTSTVRERGKEKRANFTLEKRKRKKRKAINYFSFFLKKGLEFYFF